MAKATGTTPAAQRRSAQRRLARELQQGTYRRGQAGRAYQQARVRQRTGRDRGSVEIGNTGRTQHQRQFTTIFDAAEWGAANLPRLTRSYIVVRGRLILVSMSGHDEAGIGDLAWRTVTDFILASQLPAAVPDAEAEAARLFTDIRTVMLRWKESE